MDAPLTTILCHTLDQYVGQTLTADVAARVGASILRQVYSGPVDISSVTPYRVGGYVLAPVRGREVLDDLKHLHRRHWDETEVHRHNLQMNPDYARGLELEQQGRYLLLAAIHMDSGEMVGNYGLYLTRSMHTQKLMATEDTLYILPEHRKGRLGVAMIRYAESVLRQLGVEELNVSVKLVNNVGPMIERMGYTPVATQYTKILTEDADVQP